jgi:hypothetical protein
MEGVGLRTLCRRCRELKDNAEYYQVRRICKACRDEDTEAEHRKEKAKEQKLKDNLHTFAEKILNDLELAHNTKNKMIYSCVLRDLKKYKRMKIDAKLANIKEEDVL